MFHYRSFADLDQCIARNLWRIPSDVDLIVGIPRSGLMAANMLALHLNLPLTSLDLLVEGRVLAAGQRLSPSANVIKSARKIVVLDDSILTGRELRQAQRLIESAGLSSKVLYATVYATEESVDKVDINFEICPPPRVFAWNLMHRQDLAEACVDIDGVLCVDPTEDQNDDGPEYEMLLGKCATVVSSNMRGRRLSHLPAGTLQTSNGELVAAAWHQIPRAGDVGSSEQRKRIASNGHGEFKSSVYRTRAWASWFIESSAAQADTISARTLKPVICIETQRVHLPGTKQILLGAVRNSPNWVSNGVKRVLVRMCRAV